MCFVYAGRCYSGEQMAHRDCDQVVHYLTETRYGSPRGEWMVRSNCLQTHHLLIEI